MPGRIFADQEFMKFARELGIDEQEILMDEQGTFIITSTIKEES